MKNYFKLVRHRMQARIRESVTVLTTHGCKRVGEYRPVEIKKNEEFQFMHYTGFQKKGKLTAIYMNGKFQIEVNGRREIIEPTDEGKLFLNVIA